MFDILKKRKAKKEAEKRALEEREKKTAQQAENARIDTRKMELRILAETVKTQKSKQRAERLRKRLDRLTLNPDVEPDKDS